MLFFGGMGEDGGVMLTTHEIDEMLRSDYLPTLQEQLQVSVDAFEAFANKVVCTGYAQELDGIGTTEMAFRTGKFQDKVYEELDYGKRWMYPAAMAKSLALSNDEQLTKGAFAVRASNLMEQLRKAAIRAQMLIFLGITYDKQKGYYRLPTKDEETNASGYGEKKSLYSSTNIYVGGVMGANMVGVGMPEKEYLPQQPMSAGGELMTDYTTEYKKAGDVNLEKTNVIPVNYVEHGSAENSGLTLGKLRAIRTAFELRNAVHGDQLVNLAITPIQKYDLKSLDQLQNTLYGLGLALQDGNLVSEILGIRFIVTNMLPKIDLGGGKLVRGNPAWTEDSVSMGVWDAPRFNVEAVPGKYDMIGVDCQCMLGACRRRLEGVLTVHCDEGEATPAA